MPACDRAVGTIFSDRDYRTVDGPGESEESHESAPVRLEERQQRTASKSDMAMAEQSALNWMFRGIFGFENKRSDRVPGRRFGLTHNCLGGSGAHLHR